ncbi:putative rgp1-domain-containing protein [Lyophyllum shimeji]|uniref:Rgp1-domain-containing protein n=1 Tax=Lyophyllum shimeji TaxID=47721 RepID=A0A9P3UKK9_LYOSH|nr:putative rgp1-domain-containing protein [Lyophyllum shimeji]
MPGLNSISEVDSGVRVVVTPSQSSYFAGEPFSVTITFTNTRSPEPGSSRPHTHKRAAHSISSAPLARPPTSPGTPRTAVPSVHVQTKAREDALARKGLIGKGPAPLKGAEELPELIEQRRKRLLAKSLSVTIAPHELEEQLGEARVPMPASFMQASYNGTPDPRHSPSSPRVSSPLARSDTLPLGLNHPHARKQSVVDGQLPVELISTPPALPYSPNSSTSTFSLALDPISEGVLSPYPSTPSIASPTIEAPSHPTFSSLENENTNSVYAYPPPQPGRRQSHLGLGQPPSSLKLNSHHPPRSAFSSTFPQSNTELILYSYAQLKGTLSITPVSGVLTTPEQRQTLNATRAALLKRSVVGGGRMDISSSLQQPPSATQHRRRPTHSRSSSFSSGLLSLLSPTSLVASTSAPPGSPGSFTPSHRSRPSASGFSPTPSPVSSRFPNSGGVGLGLGIPGAGTTVVDEEIDPDAPLPTFEVQPTMLAVDLSLLPGESRSYTYSIVLPDILPPTFKGRSLKFSYELVIGTCRSGSSGGSGSASASSISRVMKVPIRVYNNVVVGRTPRPYDVLWPLSKGAITPSSESQGKVVEETGKSIKRFGKVPLVPSPLASSAIGGTFDDLQDYARRLLTSFPEPGASGVRIKLPAEAISPVPQSAAPNGAMDAAWPTEDGKRLEREMERAEEGGMSGCREAVEILTRNPKKASYDVNKDGVKVAVLTFTKAAYRLGETVLGVVELNQRTSRARVLQLSAILEAHESLPSNISPPSSARHLRRVHAEHHSSFTASTLRTTFTLDIPSDASPAFQVRVGTNQPGGPFITLGGLEWKVRLCLLVAVADEASEVGTEGVRIKQLVRDGPRGEWGSSWRAPRSIAPMEKPPKLDAQAQAPPLQQPASTPRSWGSFFTASFFGSNEREYHDGDVEVDEEDDEVYDGVKPDLAGGVGVGVKFGGGEEGWKDVKLETVECEVPIKMWPGNTAFKAADIVFDV